MSDDSADDMPFPDPDDDEAIAKFLDARFERNVRRLLDRNRQLMREDAELRERIERCEREIRSLQRRLGITPMA